MSESAELEPWQYRVLDNIQGIKPGQLSVISSGCNIGKSQLNSQAFKRLWEDLHARPVEALICDFGTVYGSRYYTVEPHGGHWPEMELWCHETFGETGSIWQETKRLTPEPHKRWYANNRKFWFKDVKDRDWFILKWNS
jgi:hypothetical protein